MPPADKLLVRTLLRGPLTVRRAARAIALTTLVITIVSGILIHVTDSKEFPNIGLGLWWAIQTVTTVGYGDYVPTSTDGRIVGAIVMLVGIGFLTVVTATITAAFIESARRRLQVHESDETAAQLQAINARLASLEEAVRRAGHDSGFGPSA